MKKIFSGYYNYTEEEFRQLWEKGLIVFDTNVLLDLYRLPPDTVEYLFKIMEKIKNQLWLPYHVAFEFHNNFYNIIAKQAFEYKEAIVDIDNLKKKFDSQNHPFLPKTLNKKADDLFKQLKSALRKKEKGINELLRNNEYKDRIAAFFQDKIGECFSQEMLKNIYSEGSERYNKRIPPGYKDKPEKKGNDVYGDLVIWKELLNKAKQSDKDIIFITRDSKEDWFLVINGATLGPRPELITEFKKESGKNFYIYNTIRFIEYCQKYFEIGKNEKALAEFKEFVQSAINTADSLGKMVAKLSGAASTSANPTVYELLGINSKAQPSTSASSEDIYSMGKTKGESTTSAPPEENK